MSENEKNKKVKGSLQELMKQLFGSGGCGSCRACPGANLQKLLEEQEVEEKAEISEEK